MLIVIFGESCTGKSTLAKKIADIIPCEIIAGKDYLRLAKSEAIAKKLFQQKLHDAVSGEDIIYVIAEKEHLQLIPDGAVRILVTADIETIKSRFAQRMGGNLPALVAAMLERKHGCFDQEPFELHMIANETNLDELIKQLISRLDMSATHRGECATVNSLIS